MLNGKFISSSAIVFCPSSSLSQSNTANLLTSIGTLLILISFGLALGIAMYQKRQMHHDALIRKQRRVLEKMWQISPSQ
jgi:hypothetical protein